MLIFLNPFSHDLLILREEIILSVQKCTIYEKND